MYKRILVVVDEGAAARPAVTEGVALAQAHGADLLLLALMPRYVMPVAEFALPGPASPEEFYREARHSAERSLAAAAALAERAGVRCTQAVESGADDARCVIETARKRRCGLIVVTSAGRNALMRLLSGSVIPGLITHSTIPVLIVRKTRAAARTRAPAAARGASGSGRGRAAAA